jgi:hypothetical protein
MLQAQQVPIQTDDVIGTSFQGSRKENVVGRILQDVTDDVQVVGHKGLQVDGSDKILNEQVGGASFQQDSGDFCEDWVGGDDLKGSFLPPQAENLG